jgi:hypothetical protein
VKRETKIFVMVLAALGLGRAALAQATNPLYENDFAQATVGKVPDDFLVIDGAFGVTAEGGNKFLELPGAPLDTFGVLFGPTEQENVAVTARIYGTGKGRRFPTFAVGLSGVTGFRLQVNPAKKALELFKGDTVKTSVQSEWIGGQWTWLKLQIRKVKDGAWRVEGKAWTAGAKEPGWLISFDETEPPIAGRAALWGSPFAGTPIRYDDLAVTPAVEKP